jgi:hypothetical protein
MAGMAQLRNNKLGIYQTKLIPELASTVYSQRLFWKQINSGRQQAVSRWPVHGMLDENWRPRNYSKAVFNGTSCSPLVFGNA